MFSHPTHLPTWPFKTLTFMIHTHERILGNISDNYNVLGDIFFTFFDKFNETRPLKDSEFCG